MLIGHGIVNSKQIYIREIQSKYLLKPVATNICQDEALVGLSARLVHNAAYGVPGGGVFPSHVIGSEIRAAGPVLLFPLFVNKTVSQNP